MLMRVCPPPDSLLSSGTPPMMHTSCQLLADSLPDDTLLYCAHEYTESNARFALTVEPSNTELQVRKKDINNLF